MKNREQDKFLVALLELAVMILLAQFLMATAFPAKKTELPAPSKPSEISTSTVSLQGAALALATTTKPTPGNFSSIKIGAGSALVYDVTASRILYAKRADEKRPIASITKIMTAYAASLSLPKDTEIVISQEEAALESSSGLTAGERWRFDDLLRFTLISSSNGGAQAIARAFAETTSRDLVGEMNKVAVELGLTDTFFRNATGLDLYDGQISGSYSTASDISKLLIFIERSDPALLSITKQTELAVYSLDNIKHFAFNTNTLLANVPNILVSKTGTTPLAGGNLALLYRSNNGHLLSIVVLGDTPAGRFTDAATLISAANREGSQKQ